MATAFGGKGSFQTVKLQRPARTTLCSHSTRDEAAVYPVESKRDHRNLQHERLCSCEQLSIQKPQTEAQREPKYVSDSFTPYFRKLAGARFCEAQNEFGALLSVPWPKENARSSL
jgi:hypothetical protein